MTALAVALCLALDGGAPPPAPRPALTLLYFHASWCAPCRRFERLKVLERVAARIPRLGVETVDIDADARAEQYGIRAVPALALVDAEGTFLAQPRVTLDDVEGMVRQLERTVALVRE